MDPITVAMVWDAESGNTILAIETGHSAVYSAIYSPDETMIASGGGSRENEFIKIWDANTGKLIAKLEGHASLGSNVKSSRLTRGLKTYQANSNINHARARDLELNINPSDKGLLKNVAALGDWDAQVSDSIHDI